MSERMTDERLDLEIRRFLAWQAEDLGGAPGPADVAAALSARIGGARQPLRLSQPAGLLLLLTLLITALLGALIAGSLLRTIDHRAELSPMSLGIGAWEELVAGRDGRVWSSGEQGISVYDPSTGETRVFGLADDPLLARGWILAAAADGGIWLRHTASGGAVHFDGTELGDPITFPGGRICGLSDGDELLALACNGTVARLADSVWTTLADSFPDRYAWGLAIDGTGTFWVIGSREAGGPARVWEHRAGTWASHEMAPALAVDMKGTATAPDGSVWVWGTLGAAHHDGSAWRTLSPGEMGAHELWSFSLAADGSVWGTTEDLGLDATVFRYESGSLKTFRLPPAEGPGLVPQIVVAETGVFASVGGALAQLLDDVFTVVDPGPPIGLRHIQDIAVDADGVAWLLMGSDDDPPDLPARLGHVVKDQYAELAQRGQAIRLGADGRIWMATADGPVRLEGDSFELVGPALSLAVEAEEGARLELPPYTIGRDGTPYTVVGGANETIVRLADGEWRDLPDSGSAGAITAMAVAPDDALWVAAGRPEPTLLRFAGGQWSTVSLPEQVGGDIVSIAFDRDGTAWFDVGFDVDCSEGLIGLWCRSSRGVARLDRGEWTVFDGVAGQSLGADDRYPGRRHFGDLAVGPDGTVWLATEHGIARFDGRRWSLVAEGDIWSYVAVAVGPDGSVWTGGIGIHRLEIAAEGDDDG
jgi:hypothetical protein